MSKILKVQEEMKGHNFNFVSAAVEKMAGEKSGNSFAASLAHTGFRQAGGPSPKLGLLISILSGSAVVGFSLALLLVNMKMLDQVKTNSHSSLQLDHELSQLNQRLAKLEQFTGDFKEMAVKDHEDFRGRLTQIKGSMTHQENDLLTIDEHIKGLQGNISQISGTIQQNADEIAEIKHNSNLLQAKLSSLNSMGQNLKGQYDELRGMLRLTTGKTQ